MKITLHQGDVLTCLQTLPDNSVHCAVTSPPYWGLRDYGLPPVIWGGDPACPHEWGDWKFNGNHQKHFAGAFCRLCGAWRGSFGLEPTPELYLEHAVLIFREVRRVLRPDGTLWLNMGDSYCGSGGAGGDYNDGGLKAGQPKFPGRTSKGIRGGSPKHAAGIWDGSYCEDHLNRYPLPNLKVKDLVGMPWRLALALQADGAADPKAMQIIDRIRAALLQDYEYWEEVPAMVRREVERLDQEYAAAKEGSWWLRRDIIWAKPNPMPESCQDRPTTAHEYIFLLTKRAHYFYDAEAVKEISSPNSHGSPKINPGWKQAALGKWTKEDSLNGRNLRSVWTIATAPFPEAHFATFPPALPEKCIRAGTSEKGVCPQCGAPWVRVVEKEIRRHEKWYGEYATATQHSRGTAGNAYNEIVSSQTTGWHPVCQCDAGEPVPATVLDPFAGAGTTALVAAKLQRHAVAIELNPAYVAMGVQRLQRGLGMLAEVEVFSLTDHRELTTGN